MSSGSGPAASAAIGAAKNNKREMRQTLTSFWTGCSRPRFRPEFLSSKKQVLTPLIVALTEQSHQMATGVQAERPGRTGQLHTGLFRRSAALAIVAGISS